jgi:hypothetical protein
VTSSITDKRLRKSTCTGTLTMLVALACASTVVLGATGKAPIAAPTAAPTALLAPSAESPLPPPPNGTIAYVLTDLHWAVWESADGKTECPHGYNEGNREHFKTLFPQDGKPRTLLETQLRREVDGWYPTTAPEQFKFLEAGGSTAYGLNLDGKAGPTDFTTPEGDKGIDNQLYRVLGCIRNYRPPEGAIQGFDNDEVTKDIYNRIIIELSGVDSLVNDDDVQVMIYRGRDPILLDATGKNAIPGGSQRIDVRWGSKFIQKMHGRIKGGVLTTEPADFIYPWAVFYIATDEFMHAARFQLNLTATRAEGVIGGYLDIESWYSQMMRSYSTHHQSYGQSSAPSMYKALRRLADGYPDQSGANSAISSALLARWTQVNLVPESKAQAMTVALQKPAPPYAGPPYPRTIAEETAESNTQVASSEAR